MKQPLWKKLLSYLTDLPIESRTSHYNPELNLSLRDGRYQLYTKNAIYSFEDLYDNFSEAFKQLDLQNLKGKNILILGFGMASIPIILEKHHYKDYHYTGVEIDKEVLSLATKYAIGQLQSTVDLIYTDAFDYVMTTNKKFDLVIMDVFFDDIIPDKFEAIPFLKALKTLTKENGFLMYNRLAFTEKDIINTTAFFNGNFKSVFDQATYLEVKGNWMLLDKGDFLKR